MTIKRSVSFLALLFAILLLSSCARNFIPENFLNDQYPPRLDKDEVVSILFRRTDKDRQAARNLTGEEIAAFTDLFNASRVKICDGGTTPDFVAEITLKDGTVFHVLDCCDLLEVQFREVRGGKASAEEEIKLENGELIDYLLKIEL